MLRVGKHDLTVKSRIIQATDTVDRGLDFLDRDRHLLNISNEITLLNHRTEIVQMTAGHTIRCAEHILNFIGNFLSSIGLCRSHLFFCNVALLKLLLQSARIIHVHLIDARLTVSMINAKQPVIHCIYMLRLKQPDGIYEIIQGIRKLLPEIFRIHKPKIQKHLNHR